MRADEQEGILNDSSAKRAKDQVEAEARRLNRSDLLELLGNPAFLRWLQKFVYPCLMQAFPVGDHAELAAFKGRHHLLLEMMRDFEEQEGNFLGRLIDARENYQSMLLRAAGDRS